MLPFKDKKYFTLDTYRHMDITLKFVGRYLYRFVTIFSKKNRTILVQKLGEDKKLSKYVAGYYFKTKKILLPFSGEGGGDKALMALPFLMPNVDIFFNIA